MNKKIFHGDIRPEAFSQALIAEFNHGNLKAQQINIPAEEGGSKGVIVQIATREVRRSGGKTALSVTIERVSDGVAVHVGDQAVFGVAASLGATALSAFRNPFSLLGRLDDIAQDIESLQLDEKVWEVVDRVADSKGASLELSERLKRISCDYCETATQWERRTAWLAARHWGKSNQEPAQIVASSCIQTKANAPTVRSLCSHSPASLR